MTKAIRIENADTSNHKVVVEIWERHGVSEPDKLVETKELSHPTQMETLTIWGSRYLVIKEVLSAG